MKTDLISDVFNWMEKWVRAINVDSATTLNSFLFGLAEASKVYDDTTGSIEIRRYQFFQRWYSHKYELEEGQLWFLHVEMLAGSKWGSISKAFVELRLFYQSNDWDKAANDVEEDEKYLGLNNFQMYWHSLEKGMFDNWRLSEFIAFHTGFNFCKEDFFKSKKDDRTTISLNANGEFTNYLREKVGLAEVISSYAHILEMHGNTPYGVERLIGLINGYPGNGAWGTTKS